MGIHRALWRSTLRACEPLVGLPDLIVLGMVERVAGPSRIHVESAVPTPGMPACRTLAEANDRPEVELVDLPVFRSSALD